MIRSKLESRSHSFNHLKAIEVCKKSEEEHRKLVTISTEKFSRNRKFIKRQCINHAPQIRTYDANIVKENTNLNSKPGILKSHISSRPFQNYSCFQKLNVLDCSREVQPKKAKIALSNEKKDTSIIKFPEAETPDFVLLPSLVYKSKSFSVFQCDKIPRDRVAALQNNYNDFDYLKKIKLQNGPVLNRYSLILHRFPKSYAVYMTASQFHVRDLTIQEKMVQAESIIGYLKEKSSKKDEKVLVTPLNVFQKNIVTFCKKQQKTIQNLPWSTARDSKKKNKKMKYVTKWLKIIEGLLDGEELSKVI
jgi:hypothetical protein